MRARALPDARGMPADEIGIVGASELFALTGARTTPQIFITGELIGGADELETYLGIERAA